MVRATTTTTVRARRGGRCPDTASVTCLALILTVCSHACARILSSAPQFVTTPKCTSPATTTAHNGQSKRLTQSASITQWCTSALASVCECGWHRTSLRSVHSQQIMSGKQLASRTIEDGSHALHHARRRSGWPMPDSHQTHPFAGSQGFPHAAPLTASGISSTVHRNQTTQAFHHIVNQCLNGSRFVTHIPMGPPIDSCSAKPSGFAFCGRQSE
jgi:hypothetical protein